jgi:hypothetical protein
MKIKDLVGGIKNIEKLENEINEIFEKINYNNHLSNLLFSIPLILLNSSFIFEFFSDKSMFSFVFFFVYSIISLMCSAAVIIEKGFFINSIINNIKGFFFKRNKKENILLKAILEKNVRIDSKSEKIVNNYFNELSNIDKEMLSLGSVGSSGFKLYNFQILDYIKDYIEENDSKILKENKDNIFKLIDFIEYEEEQEELIKLYMIKVENLKEEKYKSKILNQVNDILENNSFEIKKKRKNIKQI